MTKQFPTFGEMVGKRVQQLRRRHKITRVVLSQRSGVSVGQIQHLEHGQTEWPRMRTMLALANSFGMSVAEFIEPIDTTSQRLFKRAREGSGYKVSTFKKKQGEAAA